MSLRMRIFGHAAWMAIMNAAVIWLVAVFFQASDDYDINGHAAAVFCSVLLAVVALSTVWITRIMTLLPYGSVASHQAHDNTHSPAAISLTVKVEESRISEPVTHNFAEQARVDRAQFVYGLFTALILAAIAAKLLRQR